ncbi:hypothetical protein BASA50_008818 [Batrachochytrium salamandrivorans]|uniref:Uncharacterized protein n=1 Tax=Batrachochytrium salamandrivorans TaxID=1357716 RepID=A0ABQ8F681_9FUNG|nr:hypothetical protein BASA50_008818 [Batrachochytrium salamandrivorans]
MAGFVLRCISSNRCRAAGSLYSTPQVRMTAMNSTRQSLCSTVTRADPKAFASTSSTSSSTASLLSLSSLNTTANRPIAMASSISAFFGSQQYINASTPSSALPNLGMPCTPLSGLEPSAAVESKPISMSAVIAELDRIRLLCYLDGQLIDDC